MGKRVKPPDMWKKRDFEFSTNVYTLPRRIVEFKAPRERSRFYCTLYQIYLSPKDRKKHKCHNKQKGRNKGRWCSKLLKMC